MNSTSNSHPELVLASSSPFRRQLLQRLGLAFVCQSPSIDESLMEGESVAAATLRLAREKAQAVAREFPAAIVIGSDQLCSLGTQVLGKPGTAERAHAQLLSLAGQVAHFHTAVVVIRSTTVHHAQDRTEVHFRKLNEDEIGRYLQAENVLGCAGSFKSEGLGISLCEQIVSSDPTALIGLPLVATARLLRETGLSLP